MDEAARLVVAQGMTLAALIAATVEYGVIVSRRRAARADRADLAAVHESGLRALVRISIVDER